MRFLYAVIAVMIWMAVAVSAFDMESISMSIRVLSLAIVFAGALAGGD